MILAQALDATYWAFLGRGIGAILLYAVIGTLMMLIGFWAIDLTTPGKLPQMVRAGLPNAVTITAAGMISMAFIIVLAIYASYGSLLQGVISSLVFGLIGIVVQVAAVRLLEWVTGIDIGEVIQAEEPRDAAKVVAAAHVALGLIVAVAVF
ncbi:DUF350 domain-containing protein [Pseudonocardia sp. C8]|uniref:DUF350 domain-containing protein n=1 Tax=Pseudonocardia sp. C8 TaxID=2762759 RepID=UPI0016426EE8|nr:DUF350 domain-containing protein [Pseudonocardia sp. C8]